MRLPKIILFVTLPILVGSALASSGEAGADKKTNTITSDILEVRIQTISRALVDLKLSEVALRHSDAVDKQKVSLIVAQETALEQEIEKLIISSLEDEQHRLSDKYGPEHPKMREIKAELDTHKAKLTTSKS